MGRGDVNRDAIREAKRAAAEAARAAKDEARAAARRAVREATDEAHRVAADALREAHESTRQSLADPALSAALEAAWGRVTAARRGPRPTLTLPGIVHSAVALADREGLGGVSMSVLAAQLGTKPMSLYRYVDSKEQLLALMVDFALGRPLPREPDEDWRAGATRWAMGALDAFEAHPWTLEVPIRGMPDTPNQVACIEDWLESFANTKLTPAEQMSSLLIVSGYVRNAASINAQILAAARERSGDPDDQMRRYAATLRLLAEREDFPRLHAVLDAGVFDQFDDPRDEFLFGLDRVLDGIGSLVSEAELRAA